MKKFFTLIVCAIVGITSFAQVYQFSDPGFDGEWSSSEEPGNGWTSFSSADASSLGFLASMAKNQSPKPSKVSGYSGSAVKIFSKSILGSNANGNLTTGQIHMGSTSPADASNYNVSKIDDSSHCMQFAGRPDAFYFYAKFSGSSPNGRANFILHDEFEYRDPEVATDVSHRVGKSTVLIPATSDWTRFEGSFAYDKETPSTQYLLATFTTNPTPGGTNGDELHIDDVYFVYYNTLASLEYQGATLNFSENKQDYNLTGVFYDSEKLSYTAKGAGAEATHSYNADTQLLTITVKGNDYAVNNNNVKVYTVQFGDGTPVEPGVPGEVDYTPYNIEQKTRTSRLLDSVTLTSIEYADEEANVLTINNSPAMSYSDLTETVIMKAAAGEEVTITVTNSGADAGWMNAYVYIDTDADGFTAGIASDSNWQPTGDLVAYSFYNKGISSDASGWNSAGTPISGTGRSTLDLPSFRVPVTPGVYRVRIKYDWCNIDPNGGAGTYFGNTFMGHGGQIVDFMLEIPQTGGTPVEPGVPGEVDYTPYNIEQKTRTSRLLDSVTLTSIEYADEEANVLTINNSPAMSYSDLTETVTMRAAAGEEVTMIVTNSGADAGWMNAYVYIDTDADGFTAGIADDSNWQPTGDLVAYSFYNRGASSDVSGWNSAGVSISGDGRSTLDLPPFRVPETPGVYRVRVKYDWCNINPHGGADTYFGNTFMGHGGQIVDFMLEIPQPTSIESVETKDMIEGIFDLSGRRLNEITAPGIYIIDGKKVLIK